MPRFGPVSRSDLVKHLRQLGYLGPYSGGRHQFMYRDGVTITLPNPHKADVGREDWEQL